MAPRSDDPERISKGRSKVPPQDVFRVDMHVHSSYSSDGLIKPAELVKEAARKGLNGMALTDHNSIGGLDEAKETARMIPGFIFIPGIEISTKKGHILAFGVKDAPRRRMPVDETVEWIIAAGGLPVAGHPYRSFTGIGERRVRGAKFAAVEVLNARSPRYKNEKARKLCEELGLGMTAGSDCHRLRELGRAYTIAENVTGGADGLLEMIRKRRTRAGGRSATLPEVASHSSKIGKDLLKRRWKRI